MWCVRMRICSLEHNMLGAKGAKHLLEGLAQNKALTSLKYAAHAQCLLSAANDSTVNRP